MFEGFSGFDFPFVGGFDFGVALEFCSLTKARFEDPAVELGSTNHLSGLATSDHDSLFRFPALREARRSISPTVIYCCTRLALELPGMRTSCA